MTAKDELTEKFKTLREWENTLGLNNEYLQLSRESITQLTTEQKQKISLELCSLNAKIQRELNRNIAYVNFLKSRLDAAIAKKIGGVEGYYNAEQKRNLAIASDPYCVELEDLRASLQMKVDYLNNLPFSINQIVRSLSCHG